MRALLGMRRTGPARRIATWVAVGGLLSTTLAFSALAATKTTTTPKVLLVGSYNGTNGRYASIQDALAHAQPGDWILVGPGDYKTPTGSAPADGPGRPAGVLVTVPGVHIRGMNRNGVIIDGTRSGPACSDAPGDQSPNPLNGIMVWKADNVSVENLTVCNFLAGPNTTTGNEIWWNGGDNSAKIGGWGYEGNYLNATSTYFGGESTAAQYGIFSSNWSGGQWNHTYASNFNDSGYYIGACQDQCDQTVNDAWAEFNALGYSGSNSGGKLVVENSQFDNNEDGFDTNSQNGDNPPPQDGACPNNGTSPITHTHSCWVFIHNYVHDNNNPNVPSAGSAAAGPVGTGMSLSGARDDTVMDNVFANNGAWGTILVPYPDSGLPCTGGTYTPAACIFDEWGDAVIGNVYEHNGGFGNPTNGDIGAGNFEPGPTDCFGGNVEQGGGAVTTSPPAAQSLYPACTGMTVPPDLNAPFLAEVACDSEAISIGPTTGGQACLPTANYPRRTHVAMPPLPDASLLPTMPNPCYGVPADAWCNAA